MGEIADGMIDGTFDAETGEYLGEGPGYPRVTRRGKIVAQHDAMLSSSHANKLYKRRARKGTRMFLEGNGIVDRIRKHTILKEYFHPELQDRNVDSLMVEVQKDFKKFKAWFLKNHK